MKVPRYISMLASGLLLSASLTAHATDSIKIGFLTTLSGPGAVLGQEMRDGFELALKHTHGKFGGVPVDLSIVDDQLQAESARQSVERFIKRDKVDLITGIVFSAVLLPVLPSILNSDTPYLSLNTGPRDYAGSKCNKNFFAVAFQNEDQSQAVGRFATEKGYKRVVLIAPNYPGGRETLNGFKREYKGEIAQEIYTKLNQLDYSGELASVRAAKPDAVYFFLPGGMGINFIKQFHASGMSDKIVLLNSFSDDEDTIRAVGAPMIGLYNAAHWAADLPNEANKRFVKDFIETYGRRPTTMAAQAYDTAMLIDAAVRDSGGKFKDKDALRKALKEAKSFKSVRGDFRFNNNQFPIHTIYMRVIERNSEGVITNRLIGPILKNHRDPYASECKMS